MPLRIVRNDITKMAVDAIVNAANGSLLGGGGVDGCIHRAAGPELLAECKTLGGCPTGSAKVTAAYRLPCKYVIHAVGPRWRDGSHGERELLASCYRTSLALAAEQGCETVAFPLISSGIYGYPKDQALRVAVDTIGRFLLEHDMTVYLVIFDRAAYQIGGKLFADIAEYIDDHYVNAHTDSPGEALRRRSLPDFWEGAPCGQPDTAPCAPPPPAAPPTAAQRPKFRLGAAKKSKPVVSPPPLPFAPAAAKEPCATQPDSLLEGSLDELFAQLDAGFSETLLQLIDRTGKKDSDIYKKANVDRKLFSKIRNNPDYKPSKATAIAFAIALELDLEETRDFIGRAGFALSRSSKFDVIIEYFIKQKNYDIFEINEALFAFDQSLLGA